LGGFVNGREEAGSRFSIAGYIHLQTAIEVLLLIDLLQKWLKAKFKVVEASNQVEP
jgi:hypothetical protein